MMNNIWANHTVDHLVIVTPMNDSSRTAVDPGGKVFLNQNLHVEQAVVETVVETRRRIKLLKLTNHHRNNLVYPRLTMHKIVTTIDLTGM